MYIKVMQKQRKAFLQGGSVMIHIDTGRCTGCGACAADCLNRAILITAGKAKITKQCFLCGHCIAVCPSEAVSMDDYDMADVIPFHKENFTVDPATLLNVMKFRRSVRQFRNDPVEKEQLETLVEAGRFSPTGSNAQDVSFRIVQENMEEFRALSMAGFRKYREPEAFASLFPPPMTPDRVDFDDDDFLFKGGKAVIITISRSAVNAALAAAYMELLAHSMGLGTVYIGFFVRLAAVDDTIRQWLGLCEEDQVVTALSIGYPDVTYRRTVPRKRADAVWL